MHFQTLGWLDKLIGDTLEAVYSSVNERVERISREKKSQALRSEYLSAFYERIRYINLPHLAHPKELIELFVELYVFRSIRRLNLDGVPPRSDISIIELLSEHQNLIILGEPGAGKTTFVRRIAYSVCSQGSSDFPDLNQEVFPILVECRDSDIPSAFQAYDRRVRQYDKQMAELQTHSAAAARKERKHLRHPPDPLIIFAALKLKAFEFPYPEVFLEKLLKTGRVIFFVDGLDEAPVAMRRRIVKSIENMRARYTAIRIIVTCRTAEGQLLPAGFVQYEIAPLNDAQRERFAKKWFRNNVHAADFLAKARHTHIWDLADRPLLLTLLCALYQAGGDLPRFKVDLYKECVELALRRWDVFRDIKRETAFGGLSLNQRLNILARVGAQLTLRGKTVENGRDLDSWFRSGMEESAIEGHPTDLREEIVSHSGLLLQTSVDRFEFSHKSLQEYFAAIYFSSADPLLPVRRLRTDRQWLNTTEMAACMVADAGKIILSLLQPSGGSTERLAERIQLIIRMISANPITISGPSREEIVKNLVVFILKLRKDLIRTVPISALRFTGIEREPYSEEHGAVVTADTEFMVYISWREAHRPEQEELLTIALAAVLIFKLLLPARTTSDSVRKRYNQEWIISLLNSVSAHHTEDLANIPNATNTEILRLWPFLLRSRGARP